MSLCRRMASIDRARQVNGDKVANDDADRRGSRDRYDKADEAEQFAESQKREHEPNGVKTYRFPDQLGRNDISFEELAAAHDPQRHQEEPGARPSLDQGDAERKDESGERSDVGNKAQHPCQYADQEAEIEPNQGQPETVPEPEEQTDQRLAPDKARQCVIDLSGDRSQSISMVER